MRPYRVLAATAALASLAACAAEPPTTGPADLAPARDLAANYTPTTIGLTRIGVWQGGGAQAAEISAYDHVSQRLFVVNGALGTVDVVDLRTPSNPTRVATLDITGFGASANSVSAHNGIVAIAIEAHTKTDPGTVAFYRATTLDLISSVTVGALPDMLTFSPSGKLVVVANEGEPASDYSVDPEGSVSIIDVTNVNAPRVRAVSFRSFNGRAADLRYQGIRIYGPGASVAQDLEPEYVTVNQDETQAWVTLQENNAIAQVDLRTATVRRLLPLGTKDHNLPGNGLDASDRDNAITIRNWPVFGLYEPDAIASYQAGGQTFLVTANEGDTRDYPPVFSEEARVSTLPLNPAIFTSAVCGGSCTGSSRLGRLTVTTTMGLNPATGQYDALYVPGARSFSIRTVEGRLVWDSGDQFEQITASYLPALFNANNTSSTADDRSDNKGPEPEGVALGRLGDKTYAFVGFERVGGVIVYDITAPTSPVFVTYVNTRTSSPADQGPEGLAFVPANRSPNQQPLLIVSNEISGTAAIFQIDRQ